MTCWYTFTPQCWIPGGHMWFRKTTIKVWAAAHPGTSVPPTDAQEVYVECCSICGAERTVGASVQELVA